MHRQLVPKMTNLQRWHVEIPQCDPLAETGTKSLAKMENHEIANGGC
jgi:hypothetical protein